MSSFTHTSVLRSDLLAHLMSRQSHWPLGLPIPSSEELHLAFEVAMRAPDHSSLRPWRFMVIQNDALQMLGEVFADATIKRGSGDDGNRSRAQATAAPMIIAVGAHISEAGKVPVIEQMISAGAAAMNLLNALHLLGYGAYWASGENAYDPDVRHALGLKGEADQLLGFIYVGTPTKRRPPKVRPSSVDFVTQWIEPLAEE